MEERKKRALYRATHRGIKEMDIVLGEYARDCVGCMEEGVLSDFEELLEMNDQELLKLFMGEVEGEERGILALRLYWSERRVAKRGEIGYKRGGLSDGG